MEDGPIILSQSARVAPGAGCHKLLGANQKNLEGFRVEAVEIVSGDLRLV